MYRNYEYNTFDEFIEGGWVHCEQCGDRCRKSSSGSRSVCGKCQGFHVNNEEQS